MAELLTKLLENLNSSVFILLVLLIAVGYGLWKIGGWAERFLHLNQKIDSALSMEKAVTKLEVLTELIYNNTLKNPLVQAHSPISLTEIGVEGNNTIKLNEVLAREFLKLSALVEEHSPKNAYDIQVESMRIASDQFPKILNETELIKAKEFAYAKGLRLEDISSILGVLLRNQILDNKGIPVSDVDLHQPKQP